MLEYKHQHLQGRRQAACDVKVEHVFKICIPDGHKMAVKPKASLQMKLNVFCSSDWRPEGGGNDFE